MLCWDEKRFGRFDSIEYGYYLYPLKNAGVVLALVNGGVIDWNDDTSRIVANVKQEGSHKDLRDHSANVARGLAGAMAWGGWVGSCPHAYRLERPKRASAFTPALRARERGCAKHSSAGT
jgi:hypothetical protein